MTENISIGRFPLDGNGRRLGNWYEPMFSYWWQQDPKQSEIEAREGFTITLSITDLFCIAMQNSSMIIGYSTLEGNTLSLAQVHPDYRRRGIYKEMVILRMAYAISVLGFSRILVEPSSKTEKYFTRLGFNKIGNYIDPLFEFKVR